MSNAKPASSEMHPGPGFRIRKNIPRTDNETLLERYREFETPDISDLCNRMYAMSSQIKNLVDDTALVVAEQAIADAPVSQRAHRSRQQAFGRVDRAGTGELDLPHVRHIEEPGGRTDGRVLF